jgi:hypothetical protein
MMNSIRNRFYASYLMEQKNYYEKKINIQPHEISNNELANKVNKVKKKLSDS